VWRAGDDIELFESAWNFDHFYPIFSDPTGRAWKRGHVGGAGPRDAPLAPRHARDRDPLPPPAVLANMIATLDIVSGAASKWG